MKKIIFVVFVTLVLIIADQWSKILIQQKFYLGESIPIIKNFFNFTYVQNPGAAWGMGGQADTWLRHILFRYLPVIFCFFIIYLIYKSFKEAFHLTLAYTLILAGAIGNLIDRFRLDYVVDFLDFYYGNWHFPAFNIADSAITVGGCLLVYDVILQSWRERKLKSREC